MRWDGTTSRSISIAPSRIVGSPVEERSTAGGDGREAGVTVARRFVEGVVDDGLLLSTTFRFFPVVRVNDDFTLRPAAVTAPTNVGETGVTSSEIFVINSAMTSNPTRRGGADDITTEGGKSTVVAAASGMNNGRHSTTIRGRQAAQILHKAWWWGGAKHRN